MPGPITHKETKFGKLWLLQHHCAFRLYFPETIGCMVQGKMGGLYLHLISASLCPLHATGCWQYLTDKL